MIRGARPPRALREAQDERREAVAAHHDLRARLRALSADERARMAWHAAMLADDVDGAMKLLQENLRDHPGHVPSLCELATLLQRQNARPDAAPDANTTRGPDDARREPAQDAAEALWREAAAQPGPHRLACLRQLTAIALRRGDAGQALAWRTEADQLERRTLAEYTAAPRYEPHGLGEPELRRLADMLDPLLLAATGAWLRDAASGHHVLLVLARESWILRAVGALTGEPSYLRRDCQALLQRLLPRVQRNIEPLLLAAGDPLPGVHGRHPAAAGRRLALPVAGPPGAHERRLVPASTYCGAPCAIAAQQGIAHVLPQRRQHFLGLAVLVRLDHDGLIAVERQRATAQLVMNQQETGMNGRFVLPRAGAASVPSQSSAGVDRCCPCASDQRSQARP